MKGFIIAVFLTLYCLFLFGCAGQAPQAQIVATTLPVYDFTVRLCSTTGISVSQLITEEVSCLHDYTLQVSQMRSLEQAEHVVISGAGLEEFLDLSDTRKVIDSSAGIHTADHEHPDHDAAHSHEDDPHIWLSICNAKTMAQNICDGLCEAYPAHASVFKGNLTQLIADLNALERYALQTLSTLSCRRIITFHDGFSYMAEAFDLTVLMAIEEESGSEASAKELKNLIRLVEENSLPAIFTETNSSTSSANVISAETGVKIFTLDMAMSGNSYLDAMYHNINTLKEALG